MKIASRACRWKPLIQANISEYHTSSPVNQFQTSTNLSEHDMPSLTPNASANCSSPTVTHPRVVPEIALHPAFDLIQTKC